MSIFPDRAEFLFLFKLIKITCYQLHNFVNYCHELSSRSYTLFFNYTTETHTQRSKGEVGGCVVKEISITILFKTQILHGFNWNFSNFSIFTCTKSLHLPWDIFTPLKVDSDGHKLCRGKHRKYAAKMA